LREEESTMKDTTIPVDVAKSVFELALGNFRESNIPVTSKSGVQMTRVT
jgi:hypothetical protein